MINFPESGIVTPTELTTVVSGTGASADVGHNAVAAISYSGTSGTIDSQITAVTDIADPAGTGGWTTLIGLTSGPYEINFDEISTTSGKFFLYINADSTEGSGDSLRMNVAVDGTTILDFTVIADGVGSHSAAAEPQLGVSTIYRMPIIYAKSSFSVTVARKGSFASAASFVKTGKFSYRKIRT